MASFAGLCSKKGRIRIASAEPSEAPGTAKELSRFDDVVLQQKTLLWGSSGGPHYHK